MIPMQSDTLLTEMGSVANCNEYPDELWDCVSLDMTCKSALSQFVTAIILLISTVAAIIIRKALSQSFASMEAAPLIGRRASHPIPFSSKPKKQIEQHSYASFAFSFLRLALFDTVIYVLRRAHPKIPDAIIVTQRLTRQVFSEI